MEGPSICFGLTARAVLFYSDLWLLADQIERHDQTALHLVLHNDEALSVRVNVVVRVEPLHGLEGELRSQAEKLGERYASAPEPDRKVVGIGGRG